MALYALQTAYGISAARNVATISQVFGDVNAGETTNIPPDLRQTQKAGKCQKLAGALPTLCHRWWPGSALRLSDVWRAMMPQETRQRGFNQARPPAPP